MEGERKRAYHTSGIDDKREKKEEKGRWTSSVPYLHVSGLHTHRCCGTLAHLYVGTARLLTSPLEITQVACPGVILMMMHGTAGGCVVCGVWHTTYPSDKSGGLVVFRITRVGVGCGIQRIG